MTIANRSTYVDSKTYPHHILEIVGNAIVGGVEQYVHNLAQHLPDLGFKVTCVAPYESAVTARLRDLGSMVYVTQMDDNPPWRSIQFLTELVRHQGIEVIHTHLPKAQVLGGLVGCLTNTPVITTIHGMDITSWELGIARTTGARLTVVCQAAYAQALGLGVSEDHVVMIPNGVDLRRYRPQLSGANFRKTVGLPAEAPVIGWVGRLAFEKGPDFFFQLAQHVSRLHPEAHFVMAGDGHLRAELAEKIEKAGLQDRIHLAGVWTNMREVYPAFDILVQTSRVEGMPFSLLEAMACGLPVAAMNAGGVGEIVEVGTTGYLAAIGDWAGLGDAVSKLLDEPVLRKQMGVEARRRAEQYFDLKHSLKLLAQEFHTLIRGSGPPNELEASPLLIKKDTGQER